MGYDVICLSFEEESDKIRKSIMSFYILPSFDQTLTIPPRLEFETRPELWEKCTCDD